MVAVAIRRWLDCGHKGGQQKYSGRLWHSNAYHTFFTSVLSLDTPTAFHAVQAWTDVQIHLNTLIKKLSNEALHTVPNEVISMVVSEMTQRPTLIFSSSPSFPPLSND